MVDNAKVYAQTYLILKPELSYDGRYVHGIRVVRSRNTKPALKRGEIAVRVKLNFNKQQLIDTIPVVEADVTAFATPEPELEIPHFNLQTYEGVEKVELDR